MAYVKQTWTDGAAGATPLSAARLNTLENGIAAATKDIGTTAGTVAAGDDARFSASGSGRIYYLDGAAEFGLSASETGASNATRLVNAHAAAVAANLELLLPAAIMPLAPGVVLPDQSARIIGHGSKRTQFAIPSASDNGLTIGSGPGVADNGHYGYLADFGITGPVRPAKTSKALLLINGLKFASVERLFLNGGDIGLDLKANCYGTTFRDMWIGRYGETNVGVNLRTGLESGADIPFYNCWVGGALAAYYMSPGFTNARMFGGQATLKGADTSTVADDKGIFIVGKDYETGAVGGMGSLTVHGVDVEGWWYGWALRGYGLFQVADFTDCSFLATQVTAGQEAKGVYNLTNPYGSNLTFKGCTIKGTYTSPALGVVTGTLAGEFAINEQAWFSQTPSTVNGVGQTAQGWLESTAIQSGLARSFSTAARGGKAQIVLDGTRFRTTAGVLEKSTDGSAWSAVASGSGTVAAHGATHAFGASDALPTPLDLGGGTETAFYTAAGVAAAQIEKIRHGTTAAPVATFGPSVKVSRTEQFTKAALTTATGSSGSDGVDLCSALVGMNTGTATTEVQAVGVFGAAVTASGYAAGSGNDACGLYGAGRATAGDGTGIGAFVTGRRDADTARANALEIHCANYGATAGAWDSAGFQSTQGAWINCSGNADSAAGIVVSNAFGRQFDVGIGFTAQVAGGLTGGVKSASIRDESSSATSILVGGSHATAAVAVGATAGPVTIGRISGVVLAGALLEVYKTGATGPMLSVIGATGSDRVQIQVGNGAGNCRLFAAHGTNAEVVGTVSGDLGISWTATKTFHLGRVAAASTIRISDNIGLFGASSSFGGGVGVIGVTNATTAPTTNPTGGGVLYASGGALLWKGSSGTITTIAAA